MNRFSAKNNAMGVALMILAMAGFTLTDMYMKQAAGVMPVGQVLMVLGAVGGIVFAFICSLRGCLIFDADFFLPPVLLRNLAEVIGSVCYVTALSRIDLSTASAILQATPLAVTLGAILFMHEQVSWQRWAAILSGFVGVLIIIRPGSSTFDPNALWAVVGMIVLSVRDLSTRAIPARIPSLKIATYGMSSLFPAGFALMLLQGQGAPKMVDATGTMILTGACATAIFGFWTITAAMRMGEISLVAPFRYSRILFALAVGFMVFNERPDLWTILGAFMTIVAGIYAFSLDKNRN